MVLIEIVVRIDLANLLRRGLRRLYSESVIATIDDLPVVSFADDHSDFLRVITLSFDLLRSYDPGRLRRIVSTADWIVDCPLPLGPRSGQFRAPLSAIEMDFEFSAEFGDDLDHASYYAALMVHEATHGMLLIRGFEYTKESRVQTERICSAEENRFLARLEVVRSGFGVSHQAAFDAGNWEEAWAMGRGERARRHAARIIKRQRC